tara:strand:- start:270 stop:845 length:576 start_codon:yes stop_codon:yes gene_type:complete
MLIEERNSNQNSSYKLLLGDNVGELMSKINSANIGLGYALESYYESYSKLDGIVWKEKVDVGEKKKIEPDMMYDDGEFLHIGEIKMGVDFDTKKSKAEMNNLHKLRNHFEDNGKKVKTHFISHLAKDVGEMKKGLKGNATSDINLMTGEMFCSWLGIDFDELNKLFSNNKERNILYATKTMIKECKALNLL